MLATALIGGLLLGYATASSVVSRDLFDEATLLSLGEVDVERTFVSLNSTYLAYGIAAGAALILILAVGLYLYDYYYGTSSRSDPVEPHYFYDQEQYNQYMYQHAADNYR